MEEQEINNVYAIPANFTDSGKILGGMVEPRNAVEALILILALGYPELMLIPMPSTVRIVVMVVTLIPRAVIAVMGVDGDSLFRYLGHIFRHLLAVTLLENEVPQPVISCTLGHTSPDSVEAYLSADFIHLQGCSLSIEDFPVRKEVFNG